MPATLQVLWPNRRADSHRIAADTAATTTLTFFVSEEAAPAFEVVF
jgi:hypothetical protein